MLGHWALFLIFLVVAAAYFGVSNIPIPVSIVLMLMTVVAVGTLSAYVGYL